jgi:DNA-binding CsgD family transcriptional regulator
MESRSLREALAVLGEHHVVGLVLAEPSGRVLFTSNRAQRLLSTGNGLVPPELQRFIEATAHGPEEDTASRMTLPGSRHPVNVRGTRLAGTPRHVLVTLSEESPRQDLSQRLIEQFGLSARSVRLVQLASRGLTNREIGTALRLSEASVKTYMHGVFRELGVRNRAELVALAERLANAN